MMSLAIVQRQRKAAEAMDRPARILLVRHGETDWNVEGRLQGQFSGPGEPRLTASGRAQAERVGAWAAQRCTRVDAVLTSDLARAVQVWPHTARASCPARCEHRLRDAALRALHVRGARARIMSCGKGHAWVEPRTRAGSR